LIRFRKEENGKGKLNPKLSYTVSSGKQRTVAVIPAAAPALFSVCIISIEINCLKWSCTKNVDKIPLPKSSQALRSCNSLNEFKKMLLFTTKYIFQLQSLKWGNKGSDINNIQQHSC